MEEIQKLTGEHVYMIELRKPDGEWERFPEIFPTVGEAERELEMALEQAHEVCSQLLGFPGPNVPGRVRRYILAPHDIDTDEIEHLDFDVEL